MNFASDNWAGASAPVAAALTEANRGVAPSYGNDDLTRTVGDWFAEIFEREVAVFFVATGTAANSLALASCMRPGGRFLCHEAAHAAADECGAPEFYSGGGKLVGLPGLYGKLSADTVEQHLRRHPPSVANGRAVALTLTQATEWGTVYGVDEIKAIADIAHRHGLKVHMDGARFANALVGLNASAADMTWRAGVDLLSFGGTKNGCWCAEALVVFDRQAADDMAFARKQAGQLFSKSRFVAAQFQGYFDHGHWLDNAVHANTMASRLAGSIRTVRGCRLALEPQANEVFAIWPKSVSKALKSAGAIFGEWPTVGLPDESLPGAGEECLRLVTSWATTTHDVAAFVRALEAAAT